VFGLQFHHQNLMPLTPIYTFVAHTKAEAAKVNANFALFEQCVNIAGDTLTGTLNVRAIVPTSSASYDLGSSSNKFRDIYASGTVVAATVTITTLNATTVNATLVGDGSGVTGVTEAHITDGSLLARNAANETISGTWTFNNTVSAPVTAVGYSTVTTTNIGVNTDGATHNNDLNIGGVGKIRLTDSGGGLSSCLVGGFTGGVEGRVLYVYNHTGTIVIFTSGQGTAANQITIPGGGSGALIGSGGMQQFIYDATEQKWIPNSQD
jgi:hypothetical protein